MTHTRAHTSDCEKKMFVQLFIRSSRHKCMIDLKCRAHRKRSLNNVITICEIIKFRIHDFVRQRIFEGKYGLYNYFSVKIHGVFILFSFLLHQVSNNLRKSFNFLKRKF